jgi:hypothetical protein
MMTFPIMTVRAKWLVQIPNVIRLRIKISLVDNGGNELKNWPAVVLRYRDATETAVPPLLCYMNVPYVEHIQDILLVAIKHVLGGPELPLCTC